MLLAASPLIDVVPGLMIWTLVCFAITFFVLRKYAFPPMFKAVEAREKALEEAIDGAKRDREAAAKLLAERGSGRALISICGSKIAERSGRRATFHS